MFINNTDKTQRVIIYITDQTYLSYLTLLDVGNFIFFIMNQIVNVKISRFNEISILVLKAPDKLKHTSFR